MKTIWQRLKTEEESANRSSVSDFGDDNFAIGSWESKEVTSRDGHMKLQAQVFLAPKLPQMRPQRTVPAYLTTCPRRIPARRSSTSPPQIHHKYTTEKMMTRILELRAPRSWPKTSHPSRTCLRAWVSRSSRQRSPCRKSYPGIWYTPQ